MTARMRFAYADSPYFGCCALYGHYLGDDGSLRCKDHEETPALPLNPKGGN